MTSRSVLQTLLGRAGLVSSAAIPAAGRSFSVSSSFALKESMSKDPKPEEFDKHKQDSLSKQKQGKGHWKPELASESEESVKADRMGPKEAGDAAMRRLQDRTKEAAEQTSKHGTSMSDGL
ncbi:hypothetical protein VTK73DRAFT_7332 [Phialemonium thermophilum]|uniref:Mitochondrial carrier protein pet8 n=1 Tax=Phialemonium thermophilum TaxID=223376 RepID=A0ABR3XT27_9PEZI